VAAPQRREIRMPRLRRIPSGELPAAKIKAGGTTHSTAGAIISSRCKRRPWERCARNVGANSKRPSVCQRSFPANNHGQKSPIYVHLDFRNVRSESRHLVRRRVPALQEAAMDGSSVSHSESEKRLKKQSRDRGKPPLQRAELAFRATTDLKPEPSLGASKRSASMRPF